ncbi:MAG TPA: diphosphate--fructose-6-phosphate 1-phosphotransferase [Nitrolancea sp.]|nr:diphosphate--fructose-6-phosphate 1-phosphotransferase [Nitrolancea sp.]
MTDRGNLLIAQSGGPTAVMNSSLVGAIETARASGRFDVILGARNGVEGILRESFVELGGQPLDVLDRVERTPSAALGTTRLRLSDESAIKAVTILKRYRIRAVALIGGNDSADTAIRLSVAARESGTDLAVVSIPKTIDNDLPGTDHCPGYGSIARFLALATRDSGLDTESMAALYPVKLIEVMGRNAGWVAASSALAQESVEEAPHLIFFPERPPRDLNAFLNEIKAVYDQRGFVVAVIPETLKTADGRPISGGEASWVDAFGHPYFPGPGPVLARAIEEHLRLRARYDKPGTISRMFMAAISEVDLAEARMAGAAAVRLLIEGTTDVMVTLERLADDPYRAITSTVPLSRVANRERVLPDEFIGQDGRSVTPAFRRYALPLIGDSPPAYARLVDLRYRLA